MNSLRRRRGRIVALIPFKGSSSKGRVVNRGGAVIICREVCEGRGRKVAGKSARPTQAIPHALYFNFVTVTSSWNCLFELGSSTLPMDIVLPSCARVAARIES